MTKRRLLFVALLALAVVAPNLINAAGRAGKPDMVVVMVDDLGAIDERILDRLPNIRSLFLDNGLRFDAAYAETPLCCPARASFLTGQHTRNHGVVRNRARLLNDNNTVATALHDAGYWTMMAGKYLNHPEELSDHSPAGWDKVAMLNTWAGSAWSSWWVEDQQKIAGYHDRFMLRQSMKWLRRAPASKPLFMWLASRAPHWSGMNDGAGLGRNHPWLTDVEPRYVNDRRCRGIDAWKPENYAWATKPNGFPLRRICESMLTVDEMVGKVRAEMAAQGRNPTWMFTSDNGMSWGVDGYALKNVPQAGRLPVYFAGRGVDKGRTSALVSNIDFGPTLADLGGTRMPAADGVSFASVLRGGGGGRSWMLEDHPVGGFAGKGGATGPWWGVRTPDWHLVEWHGTHLYDLRDDPLEEHDVSGIYESQVANLMSVGNNAFRRMTGATP